VEWTEDVAKDLTTVAATEYPATVENDSGFYGSFSSIVGRKRAPCRRGLPSPYGSWLTPCSP